MLVSLYSRRLFIAQQWNNYASLHLMLYRSLYFYGAILSVWKSPNEMPMNPPLCAKGGVVPPSVFNLPYSCEHQKQFFTQLRCLLLHLNSGDPAVAAWPKGTGTADVLCLVEQWVLPNIFIHNTSDVPSPFGRAASSPSAVPGPHGRAAYSPTSVSGPHGGWPLLLHLSLHPQSPVVGRRHWWWPGCSKAKQPPSFSASYFLSKMLLQRYQDVVNPSKVLPTSSHGVVHHLRTTGQPNALPFRWLDAEKLAAAKADFMKMEAEGIIRRSSSPWASPLHLVKKPDSGGHTETFAASTMWLRWTPILFSIWWTFLLESLDAKNFLKLIWEKVIFKFLWIHMTYLRTACHHHPFWPLRVPMPSVWPEECGYLPVDNGPGVGRTSLRLHLPRRHHCGQQVLGAAWGWGCGWGFPPPPVCWAGYQWREMRVYSLGSPRLRGLGQFRTGWRHFFFKTIVYLFLSSSSRHSCGGKFLPTFCANSGQNFAWRPSWLWCVDFGDGEGIFWCQGCPVQVCFAGSPSEELGAGIDGGCLFRLCWSSFAAAFISILSMPAPGIFLKKVGANLKVV